MACQSEPTLTFMYWRLLVLNKQPGIRPVVVREIWHQLFAKCVLVVRGPEANHACKDDHLCVGLKALTNGVVHMVQSIWEIKSNKEIWCF